MIELSILVKASALLALGLTVAGLARRARASVRHLWLAATLGSLAALPLLAVAVPSVTIPVPASYAAIAPQPAADAAPRVSNADRDEGGVATAAPAPAAWTAPSWITLVRLVWIAGAAAMLASLFVSLARVRAIRRDGLPRTDLVAETRALAADARVHRAFDVLEHEGIAAPLTCGLWRPAIVLPRDARDWPVADLRRALVHELEHVARADWAVQIAARLVCACYWFHPLVWPAYRGLCLEAERACDDAVLRSADRVDYADQLVLLARRYVGVAPEAMLGMAKRSDLAARVTALLDERQRRGAASLLAAAGAFVSAALVVTAIAPVRAVAQQPAGGQEQERPRTFVLKDGWAVTSQDNREREAREKREQRSKASAIDRALLDASADGDVEGIEKLLQAGANVNVKIEGDGSPLISASRANRLAAAKLLLDRGADPNIAVPGDGSPLIGAAREGAVRVMALLVERGANIELVVPGDENALISACASGHLEAVRFLVERGANVNAQVWAEMSGPSGKGVWRTPLSEARREGQNQIVTFLLASGARD
jgi:beta-lactamase regulating signal transducer with metallopeptidase domain